MKIAFAGFGEVNTPIDIIINKCRAACDSIVNPTLHIKTKQDQ